MVLTQWETLYGLFFFAFFEKIVVPILTSGGQVGTNLQFLNRIFQIQIQNACWAVPKPRLICIVPMQAARLFQTLL